MRKILRFIFSTVVLGGLLNPNEVRSQDSLGPPPVRPDTIRLTRPLRKVPINFSNRQIKLMNRIARDVPQRPLPEGFAATFVDSAAVSFEHVTALEDYFSATVESAQDSSLFDVVLGDSVLRSTAWIKAWAYHQANIKMREQFVFQSQDERKNYKESLEKNFRRKIDIELTVRSQNALAAHLDTATAFEIYLVREPQHVPPNGITYGPIITHFSNGIIWYERKVNLEFPRFVRARDFWRGNKIILVVKPRDRTPNGTMNRREYTFKFTAPRSG